MDKLLGGRSQENHYITLGKNIQADYDFDIIKGSYWFTAKQQYKGLWDCVGVNYSKKFSLTDYLF